MSKYTINAEDGLVYVDGRALRVDCSDLPDYFHAIQWDGEKGHIEYAADAQGRRLPNTHISSFAPYMYLVDRWTKQKNEKDAEAAAAKEKRDAENEAKRKAAIEAQKKSPKRKKVR